MNATIDEHVRTLWVRIDEIIEELNRANKRITFLEEELKRQANGKLNK